MPRRTDAALLFSPSQPRNAKNSTETADFDKTAVTLTNKPGD